MFFSFLFKFFIFLAMQIISSHLSFFLALFLEVNFDAIFISGLTLVTAQQVVLPKTVSLFLNYFFSIFLKIPRQCSPNFFIFSASLDAFPGRKFDEDKINMHINGKLTENTFE
jgi:hypothetical protein